MRKGFTLIELLIVIGLVSGLAFIATKIVNPVTQMQIANDEKRKKDLAKIAFGLENYYRQFGSYPLNPDANDYRIKGFKIDHPVIDWGEEWKPFIDVVPKDPSYPSKKYVYYVTYDGQAYYLYASLDRGSKDAMGDTPILSGGKNACGGVCNYGISSRNVTP